MAVLSSSEAEKKDNSQEQYRIIAGQRFKAVLVSRDTDCFRNWMSNADMRCSFKEKPNYRLLASQLVSCEAEKASRQITNCSKAVNWKTCFNEYEEQDLDNYAAYFPEIASYCSQANFENKSVTSETMSEIFGGVKTVLKNLDTTTTAYPLLRIALSQIIVIPNGQGDFKKGQLVFYIIIFAIWVLCKSFLKWGCEEYMLQVLFAGAAEIVVAAIYNTNFGIALVNNSLFYLSYHT